jgi:hypothetical protein
MVSSTTSKDMDINNSSNKQYSSVERDEVLKLDHKIENKNAEDSTEQGDDLQVYESCGCCFGVRYVCHPSLCLSNH